MKLYDASTAPNPRIVRIFLAEKGLAEKGIEIPSEEVDIVRGRNREPAFLKINPMGGVPVLELDDGTYISETAAICRYFELKYPEPALMGGDAKEQALVEMWRRRMELEVVTPMLQVFRNTSDFFKGRVPQSAEWAEISRRMAEKRLQWLDSVLRDRTYVAGDRYTIADIQLLVGVDFGRVAGFRAAENHQHIGRWHRLVSDRPGSRA